MQRVYKHSRDVCLCCDGPLVRKHLHDRNGACHDGRDVSGLLSSDFLLLPLDGDYGRRNSFGYRLVHTRAMEVRNGEAR